MASVEYLVGKLNENLSKRTLNENIPLIRKQVEKGRMKKGLYAILPGITKLLQAVYPDRWDLQFEFSMKKDSIRRFNEFGWEWWENKYYWDCIVKIIVWFPEITITNTAQEKHEIKDLFIRTQIGWQDNHPFFYKPDGARTTVTFAEFTTGYAHSHLNPSDGELNKYNEFCTGSEGQINTCLARLNSEFSEDEFQLYLYQVDLLAKWESKEGTPYYYFNQIGIVDDEEQRNSWVSGLTGIVKERIVNKVYLYYERHPEKQVNLSWRLVNGKIKLVDDEKFENFFRIWENPEENLGRTTAQKVIGVKLDDGTYTPYYSTRSSITDISEEPIYFRGEAKTLTVLDRPTEEETPEEKPQYCIHPHIKNYVREQLEARASKKAARMVIDRIFAQASNI